MQITEKCWSEHGINFHFIQSKKFKTINLIAKLKSPLERETITKRALLPYILRQGTKSYPTRMDLQSKLDDLYGAVLSVDGGKKGENHILTFRMEIANPKFLQKDKDIIKEAIQLFNELLFSPNVVNNKFDENVIEREKETLKQKIHAIKDDKMRYANMRLIDEMCKDEPYSLHVHGYEEDLTSVTSEELFTYYEKLIKEDQFDLYVLGDFDEERMKNDLVSFMKRDSKISHNSQPQLSFKQNHDIKTKEVIENENIGQAKLHIGYRTNTYFKDKDYAALQVFNGVFGAFPSSKLFINVREKNSLAYYASSRMESHKGLLLVFSGIAPNDYEKARDIIREQMVAMNKGEFTEEDLSVTKEMITNQLLETLDHPQGLIELLYQQVVGEKDIAPDEIMKQIKDVTKEDVIQVAQKIEEDTIFLLTSEGGGNESE